jgi:2-methylcitrate dehydratase PrpD
VRGAAADLGDWAARLQPDEADLSLAAGALRDTVAVAVAAREHPLARLFQSLDEAGCWAALAHVLDFDDLHMPSTAHVSAICVPATLAAGGDARAYLAGAGVMARLGTALGWRHYQAGWHATCTAGAPGAAATAAVALGLDAAQIATAIVLALPAAGGIQRAFGTAAKSLQVGFAADAGVRAARLAQAGATADRDALEDWMRIVGGDPAALGLEGPAVPGGLAVKLYPCCYALQRPISAIVAASPRPPAEALRSVVVRSPESSLTPLIHHAPTTGLEGKFSLEYGVVAAVLDGHPGLDSFTDEAVARPEAQRMLELVRIEASPGGDGLLHGELEVELSLRDGELLRTTLSEPPGSPGRPASHNELEVKLRACAPSDFEELRSLDWGTAPGYLTTRV